MRSRGLVTSVLMFAQSVSVGSNCRPSAESESRLRPACATRRHPGVSARTACRRFPTVLCPTVSFDENAARAFIAAVPEGSWTTYGDVADAAGSPGAAQHAGNWLRDSDGSVPFYWRVIDANGEVPPGFVASALGLPRNPVEARARLRDEGVIFTGQRADRECLYTVDEWRAAGRPSGAEAAAAWQLSELETYIKGRVVQLPADLGKLETLARSDLSVGDAVAVNRMILADSSANAPAHIRLGRAYEALGLEESAGRSYEAAVALDHGNAIARRRLEQLIRRHPPRT